jgi:hypothetical protein
MAYELLRPIVLYGDPAVQRAKETGAAPNTLERKADTFDEQEMVSVFASKPRKQKWVASQRGGFVAPFPSGPCRTGLDTFVSSGSPVA